MVNIDILISYVLRKLFNISKSKCIYVDIKISFQDVIW